MISNILLLCYKLRPFFFEVYHFLLTFDSIEKETDGQRHRVLNRLSVQIFNLKNARPRD